MKKTISIILTIVMTFSMFSCLGVASSAASTVKSITYTMSSPVEFVENYSGYWETTEKWDEEKQEYVNDEFFIYYLWFSDWCYKIEKFTVKYSDGKTKDFVFDDEGWDYYSKDGECFEYSFYDNQYDNPWVLGDDNSFIIEAYGKKVEIPVTILENPVASVTYNMVQPIEFYENVGGEVYEDWDEENDTYEWYRYYVNGSAIYGNIDKFIVNYKDGTSETFFYDGYDGYYSDDDKYLQFSIYEDQWNKHWKLGSENSFTISAYGYEMEVPVTVVENNIASVSLTLAKPFIIRENEYYYPYDLCLKQGNVLKLKYTDGTTEDFISDGKKFASESGKVLTDRFWTVEYEEYWQEIGTYNLKFICLGKEINVPLQIVSGTIESVSFTPKKPVVANNYNEYPDIYKLGNKLTVTYADGRKVDYEYRIYENEKISQYEQGLGWYDENNELLPANVYVYHDYDNLVVGKKYNAILEVSDYNSNFASTKVPFTVIENPVENIAVNLTGEITLIHNIDSYREIDYDDAYFDYFYYSLHSLPDGSSFKVDYKDGTSSVFVKKVVMDPNWGEEYVYFMNEEGDFLDCYYWDEQWYDHWEIGTNRFYFDVYGVSTTVPVTVVPGPVSMSVTTEKPIEIKEHKHGGWNTYSDEGCYYQYDCDGICDAGWKITLNYADGSTKEYIAGEYDQWAVWYAYSSTGEKIEIYGWAANQPWTVGEVNFVEVSCGALTTKVPVTIIDDPAHELTVVKTVKATCTQEGYTRYECKGCDEIIDADFVEKKDHKSSSWITDKKATVNAAGKKHKECTECGKVLKTATIKQLKCSKPKVKEIENTSSGVKISWGKVSGADKYAVYRKVKGGSYSKIGTTSKTSYTDKKAKSGKTYYYIVKAVNEAGSSDSSSSKSIKYLADPTLKTPSSTKKGIVLKWSKVTGAQGYMVYRKTGSGSYSKIATVKGSTKVTYTDKKAKKGKKYTYKVKAYYSKTYSAYSNTKTIKDKY